MFKDFEEFLPPCEPRLEAVRSRIVSHSVRSLKPDRCLHRPALFLLEIVVALLSFFALRGAMMGSGSLPLLAAMAAGAWAILLGVALARTVGIHRKWCARRARCVSGRAGRR